MNCIRHDSRRIISLAIVIEIKMTSNLKLIRNAVMSFNLAAVKVGRFSGYSIVSCFSVTAITWDDAQCKFQMKSTNV